MIRVGVVKDWFDLDIFRQTPENRGIWDSILFTEDYRKDSDYIVILNRPQQDSYVNCPPHHLWAIIQEPPNEVFKFLHFGDIQYSRIYTTDEMLIGSRYFHVQPALCWRVNKNYDYLLHCNVPDKKRTLSWITSNKTVFHGHRARMKFLKQIPPDLELDLMGYGFKEVQDKWDGLSSYKYSLAIENFSNRYYWSEKISDCFLSWTMPIYFGCSRISDYFPEEALIQIDIRNPDSIDKIREAISANTWKHSLDAIAHSRELILNRYQLFPFLSREIGLHEDNHPQVTHKSKQIFIPRNPRVKANLKWKIKGTLRRIIPIQIRHMLVELIESAKRS
jgi:hypothetical protein